MPMSPQSSDDEWLLVKPVFGIPKYTEKKNLTLKKSLKLNLLSHAEKSED